MTAEVECNLGALRRRLASMLNDAFIAGERSGTPMLDARLLVAHAFGIEPARLALHDGDIPDKKDEARAVAFIERRIAGEPVARIIGRREFWGLDFKLGPDTLVPRPDTETLVEAVLGYLDRTGKRGRAHTILDIGTGSGAIALALLSELPAATAIATDCSVGALSWAAENARRFDLADRIHFLVNDWAAAVGGQFDLVLSNPPYIESGAIATLQLEVAVHDPHMALDGGADGLDAYRRIIEDLDRLLAAEGRAFLEIGFNQAGDVGDLAKKHGYSVQFHRDLGGIERVAELYRAGQN